MMDARTAVVLAIIGFEVTLAFVLAGIMCRAIGAHPLRAMLRGAEIVAFMVLAILPAPRIPGRHRECAA